MATQKVPLTRIDETGASEGKVLKYSSGALAWGDDNSGGGGGGGDGTAFKNTVLGTESVSANSLEQYQVHSGLEILSGGSFTIAASGDLVLDAPDDPHKAAGWTDSGNVIHTTDHLNKVVIGQTTTLSADDMLSVAGGNVTVAGSVSAQGDVYGNARTMTNPGMVIQQQFINASDYPHVVMTSVGMTNIGLSGNFTPLFATSKIYITFNISTLLDLQYGGGFKFDRWVGGTPTNLFNGLNNSGAAYYDAYITEAGGNTSFIYRWQHMVEDDLSDYTSGSIFYEVSASATSSSYDFHVNLTKDGTGGSGTTEKNTQNWMLIQEIAQ